MKNRGVHTPHLKDKIKHLLEEIRIVLPGTQALLGFQFAATFSTGFEHITENLQYLHLMSLGCITITTILLLTPAAYDRVAERDKDTEHFHQLASRFVLAAMMTLALGLSLELYVISTVITHSEKFASVFAFSIFTLAVALWFGFSWWKKD